MKTETKNIFFKSMRELFIIFYIFILFLPCFAVARDFLSSVENASGQIRQIIAVVGVLALNGCRGLLLLVKEAWNGKTISRHYRDCGFCRRFNYLYAFLSGF